MSALIDFRVPEAGTRARGVYLAAKKLTRVIQEALSAPHGAVTVIRPPRRGMGKTTETVRTALMAGQKVDLYVNGGKLAREQAELWQANGYDAVHVAGRMKWDEAAEEYLCQKHKLIVDLDKLNHNRVGNLLCLRKGGKKGLEYQDYCEYFDGCAYIRQYDDLGNAHLIIRAHNHLLTGESTVESHAGCRAPDVVIIDEDFLPAIRISGKCGYKEFNRFLSPLPKSYAVIAEKEGWENKRLDRFTCFAELPRVIQEGRLSDWWRSERLLDVMHYLELHDKICFHLVPREPEFQARYKMETSKWRNFKQTPREMFEALFNVVRHYPEQTPEQSVRWHPQEYSGDVISYGARMDMKRIEGCRVIHLDATANQTLLDTVFPQMNYHEIEAPMNLRIIQILRGKRKFTAFAQVEQMRKEGHTELEDVMNFAALMHQLSPTGGLYVGQKRSLSKVPPGISTAHFGNLRGLDQYKDANVAVLFSRLLAPVHAAEREAMAHGDVEFTGQYEKLEVEHLLKDGSTVPGAVASHKDPLVAAVLNKSSEEMEQAVARLRPIHRQEPALVFVFAEVALPFAVDAVIDIGQVLGRSKLMTALYKTGGVLPLNKTLMHQELPEVFRSEAAASNWSTRLVREMQDKPIVEYGCGFITPRVVEYRLPGRRRGSPNRAVSILPDDVTEQHLAAHHLVPGIRLL